MAFSTTLASRRQIIFKDIVTGTLIYAVVMGFFGDYTHILYTSSFSVTFMAALVMELLTFGTLALKDVTVAWYRRRQGRFNQVALILTVWLIIFLSKFVFLWVIDVIFGSAVAISGFFGLLIMILVMTISDQVLERIYQLLGDQAAQPKS